MAISWGAALVAVGSLVASVGAGGGAGAGHGAEARHVTRVHVVKSAHRLDLESGERVVASYRVAIGPGGAGPKRREGDNVTPTGRYHVVTRHASRFHLFLALDYPNAEDRARFERAKASGELPKDATIGGDVGIHGTPNVPWKDRHKEVDWTAGCIAVDDAEIDAIAARVSDGVAVDIDD